jgi:hypothetical protein
MSNDLSDLRHLIEMAELIRLIHADMERAGWRFENGKMVPPTEI